eukprot:403372362
MESQAPKDIENSQQQIFSVSNQRRVLKSLTKFRDPANQALFFGCDAMYAHNQMDGKLKVFSFEDLVASSMPCSNVVGNTKKSNLREKHYVETQYGVGEGEYFYINGQEFLVAGQDDGTVQIYDYGKNKSKASQEKTIFKVTNEATNETLQHPDDIFAESLYEHTETVTAIEKNFKNPLRFASAGRDSSVCFWHFSENDEPVVFESAIEKNQFAQESTFRIGSVTGLKWLEEEVVVVALNDGTLQTKDLREDSNKNCNVLHQTDCAIWDMALLVQSSGNQIIIAEDSGKVKSIDPRNGKEFTLLTEGFHESALKLSIDNIQKTNQNLLTVGFSQSISILDFSNPQNALRSFKTSDNISCVKTIYNKPTDQVATIFGTYDGRINYTFL